MSTEKKEMRTKSDILCDLTGKIVTLWCMNYIYTGKLSLVDGDCVMLDEAKIVYETGPLMEKTWKDAQPLPSPVFVMLSAVESFGVQKQA